MVCDDFRRFTDSEAAARAIDRFRRGWRINTLLSRDECRPARELPGSSTNRAWTSRRRWRFTARAIVSSPDCARRPNGSRAAPAVFDYLQGGSALQECLANGWIGYDLTVFRRRE